MSLSVTVDGTVANTDPAVNESKTILGSADLVFDLPDADIISSAGVRSVSWSQNFGGSVSVVEYFSRTYKCNADNVTEIDTTRSSFSSASAGSQPGGVQLSVNADGSYNINATALYTGMPTVVTTTNWSMCPTPFVDNHTSNAPGIPYEQYFVPFFSGAMGYFSGKIDNADPNHVKGTWHGTDQQILFSYGTTTVTIPVEVTVVWDITFR